MKKISTLILLVITGYLLQAQAPNLQVEKSLGGSENEFAFDIHQISDGGYIIGGQTASNDGNVTGNHGDEDFWIVKLNKNGSIKWQKALGGLGDESAFSVQETKDGGFVAAGQAGFSSGQVTGNHGMLDVWVVKLDVSGTLRWQRSFGGSNRDFANSIQQTTDGGYIVAGGSFSNDGDVTVHHGPNIYADYWILKLDSTGIMQWQRVYGGSKGDIAMSVRQTFDGGYIVAGNSFSTDGDVKNVHDSVYGDFWILKLDTQGKIQWQKAFGGSDYEQANSIVQTADSGYAVAGWNRSPNDGDVTGNHGDYDFWIVKMNAKGKMQWQKSLGGTGGDVGYSIKQTPDDSYVVAGGTSSNNGDVSGNHGKQDFWLAKINSKGKLLWQKALGGSEFENAHSVDLTKDGGYVMAGSSGFQNVNNGDVTGNHGNYDFWLTKLSSSGFIANNLSGDQSLNSKTLTTLKISPNPATSFLSVSFNTINDAGFLKITNSSGKAMFERILQKGNRLQVLDIRAFPAGLYFLTIQSRNEKMNQPFIKK